MNRDGDDLKRTGKLRRAHFTRANAAILHFNYPKSFATSLRGTTGSEEMRALVGGLMVKAMVNVPVKHRETLSGDSPKQL